MANFNNETTQKEFGMYLQVCLTNEELENLKNKWNDAGYKVIPCGNFLLKILKLAYKSEIS